MGSPHATPLRGLLSTSKSPSFQGSFGRLFRLLPAASFGRSDAESIAALTALGAAMSSDFDEPKDGRDSEESAIPALYTYFGQFVDHDITFDPASMSQDQHDSDAIVDFRTPALDLDCVYGRGPNDQPYMYQQPEGRLFAQGPAIGGGSPRAHDLPRNIQQEPQRALIGDPRNDENTIVSQFQGLMHRFHNALAVAHPELRDFDDVQQLVRWHYQYVIVNDFLPRIVEPSVLSALKRGDRYDQSRLEFFRWRNLPFMPVEFSGAAYRFGHSMVRPGYRLNDDDRTLLPIFPVPAKNFPEGLTGFRKMNDAWGIDWGRLIDIDVRPDGGSAEADKHRLQFAYRIDTSLVNPLANLPHSVVPSGDPPPSLAARNLIRGLRLGLPSGQRVARAMRAPILRDEDILIGKATGDRNDVHPILSLPNGKVFADNCPLWTYILAEAMHGAAKIKSAGQGSPDVLTPRLGPVGGRIVAEVFLGMLFGDSDSYLASAPTWHPGSGADFKLADLVKIALGN